MQKLLLISFFLLCNHHGMAQYEETDFVRYTVKDGLNDNYITCLQQDDLGYVWAGTDIGLNRFDGTSFKNFYAPAYPSRIISGNIKKIKRSGPHQFAIIGYNGFQLLNTQHLTVKNYSISDSTAFSIPLNDICDAYFLPNRSIALATAAGFNVFDSTGKLTFRHDAYALKDIGKRRIYFGREIFGINDHEYLVYKEEKGLAYFNSSTKMFRDVNPGDPLWKIFVPPAEPDRWVCKFQLSKDEFLFFYKLTDSVVYFNQTLKRQQVSSLPIRSAMQLSWESKLAILSDSSFVISDGTKGFYRFHINRQSGKITGDGKKFLPGQKITCLFVDADKRIWAGTDEGLFQQKLNKAFVTSTQYKPNINDTLTGGFSCVYSHKDKLYAGRFSLNKGLLILDAKTMLPEREINFFGGNNGSNEIFSMQMYHPDTLWLGTNGGILWLDTKTNHYGKLSQKKKHAYLENFAGVFAPARPDGYAWMCSYLGGAVARYDIAADSFTVFTSKTNPALPFDKVKSIAYDSYGDVWIAGHSLTRFSNSTMRFDTLITVYGGINKFNDNILTMAADEHGSLWLHNASNGLLEYRIKEKKFIPYTGSNGLPAELFQCFSDTWQNKLWMGSNSNLSSFDVVTKKLLIYGQQDGLPDHRPTGRRIYLDPEQHYFYMCANDYLVRFPAQAQNIDATNNNSLLVEQLTINNNNFVFQPADKIRLNYYENNLLLYYTVIDYETNDYRFFYKINAAGNWIATGREHSINLTNLQPGEYRIQLKALGKTGDEKLNELSIIIDPPFWKTTWFLLALALCMLTALYFLYRQRIKKIQQRANIDKLLAQTEMKALHAQMNPHFIFNSLNSIREMILINDNGNASHFLSKFAQLIRMTLDQSGRHFISLRNTIDYLQRYVDMEQIRNNHFTCSIVVQDELDPDEILLPPMLIQPFIENAIWHGSADADKMINIQVLFKKLGQQLVCIVEDDGIGIEKSLSNKGSDPSHNPVGIGNIKNRIALLNEKYNLQSSLAITDKSVEGTGSTGTSVTLSLPLEISGYE